MKRTKIAAGFLCILLLLTGSLSTQAAQKDKLNKPPQPVEIVADEMYFSDATGELFAKGNVVITQDKSKIYADIMRGNDKQTEVWVDGKARLIEPRTDITGVKIHYNYGQQFGTIQQVKGKCGDDFVSGSKIHFENGKYTAYNATTTGCPAVKPDYKVTARKVEIWPGDKMIAYDAQVWIKDTIIYSTPRYKRSLRKDDNEDEFPHFGYYDTDGFWVSQRFSYALSDNVSAFADLAYYTRSGFRPTFGVTDQEKNYAMRLIAGRSHDDNNNWISKEPEFRFDLHRQYLGKLPVSYTLSAVIGQWKDDLKTSWHQDYNLYFRHDPIFLDRQKTWIVNLGTGFQNVRESYDGSNRNVFRYNAALTKKLSPSLTAWTAYNFTNNNNSAFAYNRVDVGQEGVLGLSWRVDNRTTVSYYTSYDMAKNRTYENYYRVKHSFHCWETDIIYRAVKKELIWTVAVARW